VTSRAHTKNREKQAIDAFQAHQAMLITELRWPHLADNPAWRILREDAFAQFHFAFAGEEK
jgi:Fe-S cluster biosynthesis and repair protein YggX